MITYEWATYHYKNKKITEFIEREFKTPEEADVACRMLNFIKEEYPEVAQPLFGDLIWSKTKEGTWPQQ